MNYERQYIQYNDLVFDEYDMVDDDSQSASFKEFSSEYGFTHGSYSPYKTRGGLLKAASVSMTLKFSMKKLPCEHRPFYLRHIKSQLDIQGKLWAVENNTMIWAYAHLSNFDMQKVGRKNYVEIDVDFELPEGVWHKASKQKTFLTPFDVCDFMDCYDYHDIDPCECCHCDDEPNNICNCCDCLEKDMALCYHKDLQDFYARCGSGYRVIYDCEAGQRFFGDFYGEGIGQRICSTCGDGIIAGQLYSDTDIPTKDIRIILHGTFKNPRITINGNTNQIMASSDDVLIINPDGSVYKATEECRCEELLSVSSWVIPTGNTYGWTVNPGNNRVVIEVGECCGTACAYIEVDSLTY